MNVVYPPMGQGNGEIRPLGPPLEVYFDMDTIAQALQPVVESQIAAAYESKYSGHGKVETAAAAKRLVGQMVRDNIEANRQRASREQGAI